MSKTISGTKDYPFYLGELEVTLPVNFSYLSDPGKTDGPPERCYPPEEEIECYVENSRDLLRKYLMEIFLDAADRIVEGLCLDMCKDGTVAEWAEEASEL